MCVSCSFAGVRIATLASAKGLLCMCMVIFSAQVTCASSAVLLISAALYAGKCISGMSGENMAVLHAHKGARVGHNRQCCCHKCVYQACSIRLSPIASVSDPLSRDGF